MKAHEKLDRLVKVYWGAVAGMVFWFLVLMVIR